MKQDITIEQLAKLKEAIMIGYHYAATVSRKEINEPPHKPGRGCADADKLHDALVFIGAVDETTQSDIEK